MTTATLADITLGTARPSEAREIIHQALQNLTAGSAKQIYVALRAWIWKALDERRRDDELREWFDIVERTSAALRGEHETQAIQLGVLGDLLYESISTSEVMTPAYVLGREHVKRALEAIDRAGGVMERSEIGKQIDLDDANLSRILNMMSSAKLVETIVSGQKALIQLTKLAEQDRKAAFSRSSGDPLAYETRDVFACALNMAEAAISGKNRSFVEAEIAAVEDRFKRLR